MIDVVIIDIIFESEGWIVYSKFVLSSNTILDIRFSSTESSNITGIFFISSYVLTIVKDVSINEGNVNILIVLLFDKIVPLVNFIFTLYSPNDKSL